MIRIAATGTTVTSSASNQIVAVPNASNGQQPYYVRLVADVTAGAYVKFGYGVPMSATVTVGGTNNAYAAIPGITFAAPVNAVGTTATGHARMKVATAPKAAGGATYSVSDVLTVVGGTGTAATLTVATLSADAVATVTVTTAGQYTVIPANPVAVTGGGGTGATFNVTWSVDSVVVDNVGAGYSVAPAVTVSAGNATASSALNGTPVTATANDMLVTPQPVLVHSRGIPYIGILQNATTAAGKINITPIDGI